MSCEDTEREEGNDNEDIPKKAKGWIECEGSKANKEGQKVGKKRGEDGDASERSVQQKWDTVCEEKESRGEREGSLSCQSDALVLQASFHRSSDGPWN